MMFRSLTIFDALLGFDGDIHCVPMRVGRSRYLVGDKRAFVFGKLCSQLFFHQGFQQRPCFRQNFQKESVSLTWMLTCSALPH